jgi:hypothetical protein
MTVTKVDIAQKIPGVHPNFSGVHGGRGIHGSEHHVKMFRVDSCQPTCVVCIPVGLRGNWNIHQKRN